MSETLTMRQGQGFVGLSEEAFHALTKEFGNRISDNITLREQHANPVSWHPIQKPDIVFYPQDTCEIARVVGICAEHKVPIIPFGTGTSLEGGCNAPFGGVSIDLSEMNNVLSVNEEDMDCTVQAGVTRKQLNAHLRDTGLFFPVDPGADASIGGMASTRASGTSAVRYGTMKESVLGLTVVTPDGQIRKLGTRARKSAAGYDLVKLFVGSEGTLGVISEVTVRLHGVPEAVAVSVCSFPDLKSACDAVVTMIRCNIPVARVELLDDVQIRACNMYSNLEMAEAPTLFVEFNGTEAGVQEQMALFKDIAADAGSNDFQSATDPSERQRLWQARHDVYWACFELRPGSKFVATDICVPISRLAESVSAIKADIEQTGLIAPIVGHVGDGNVHASIMVDPDSAEEISTMKAFIARLNSRAIAMGGTCSGEHGIGQGKHDALIEEHGSGVDLMQSLKQTLDPNGIMNPGKIFAPS